MSSPILFGLNANYLLFFCLIPLLLGGIASMLAKRQLSKYSEVAISTHQTGAQAAGEMLNFHGVNGVLLYTGANGQDFYNPRNNSITLSQEYFSSASIAATAVACHEAGHACQRADAYLPYSVRSFLVPVVNFCSNAWIFILLLGFFFNLAGLINLAIVVFAAVLLFQLVTLPVEFNAPHRAVGYTRTLDLNTEEIKGAKRVLRACAFTYVIAALIAALQLFWILAQRRGN